MYSKFKNDTYLTKNEIINSLNCLKNVEYMRNKEKPFKLYHL